MRATSVADPPGLEPGQAEPKSAVLPLHHGSVEPIKPKNLFSLLTRQDSNLDKQIQSLLCYHYTTGQSLNLSIANIQL